jgi:hypothetical protein
VATFSPYILNLGPKEGELLKQGGKPVLNKLVCQVKSKGVMC